MQTVLIVSATLAECRGLLRKEFSHDESKSHFLDAFADFRADLLITGVGSVPTTFHLTRTQSALNYKLLVNIGLAGTFRKDWPLGKVVLVQNDCFADLGAEDHDDFIDVFDLGLSAVSGLPFSGKKLEPLKLPDFANDKLATASGITVNTVHGNERSIEKVISVYQADVESMEGAAFFYTANMFNTPSFQIRAISNYVEPRNRPAWKIDLALKNLHNELIAFMKSVGY